MRTLEAIPAKGTTIDDKVVTGAMRNGSQVRLLLDGQWEDFTLAPPDALAVGKFVIATVPATGGAAVAQILATNGDLLRLQCQGWRFEVKASEVIPFDDPCLKAFPKVQP